MLLLHCARLAASRADWTAGRSRAISTAMIAMTTRSSIRVKAGRFRAVLMDVPLSQKENLLGPDGPFGPMCQDRVEPSYYTGGLMAPQVWRTMTRSWRTCLRSKTPLRSRRTDRGWSQAELARRSGLCAGSRRHRDGATHPVRGSGTRPRSRTRVPGPKTCFNSAVPNRREPQWAWPPGESHADIGWRTWAGSSGDTPPRQLLMGVVPHDGIYRDGFFQSRGPCDPCRTLVIACCDPAVGLLADELAHPAGVRLIALHYPSRMALTLLGRGLVHAAGVHLTTAGKPDGNARVVRRDIGTGFKLLRVARWEEGIAFAPGRRFSSVRAVARSDLRWIGRESGSGARQCLDEVLSGRPVAPRFTASDHRGVAEAIRSGCADAGVCLRLVSDEAGLDFLGVREEAYDLCFSARLGQDPRIQALRTVVRSPAYRNALGDLPGYDTAETGELQDVS